MKKGKLITESPETSGPYAYCDRTGFQCLHKDLRRQYEWIGGELVYTGLMVHKDYLDEPNPLGKTLSIEPDKQFVRDARPFPYYALPPIMPAKDPRVQEAELRSTNFELNKRPDYDHE